MKSSLIFIICLACSIGLSAQNNEETMDSLSYSLGVMIAKNLKSQGFDNLSAADLAKGVEDIVKGKVRSKGGNFSPAGNGPSAIQSGQSIIGDDTPGGLHRSLVQMIGRSLAVLNLQPALELSP